MYNKCMKDRRGFTLIELLVVIAIIGILSSVVLASLNSARSRARDAERASDIHQMRVALELYYSSNGSYPSSANAWLYSCSSGWATLQTALAPYMSVPIDPKNTPCTSGPWSNGYYNYAYISGPAWPGKYDLIAQFENPNNPQSCSVTTWYYHTSGNESSWCASYSPNMFADH